MSTKLLYPEIEPYESGHLKTEDGLHEIYYEVCGNPNGEPIVFVHGGPGGGCNAKCRRFFDPNHYKIVLFDQRGCGRSKPSLSLKNNETDYLIKDMEMIREHLDIDTWTLFGGSWGSTLSLCYAIKHPEKVNNLVLRGVFLARKQDLIWLYQEGTSLFNPEDFEIYKNIIPEDERDDYISAYHKLMHSDDEEIRHKAFVEWAKWESLNSKIRNRKFNENDDLKGVYEISVIENHYFYNNCFFEENYILNNVSRIKDIPTYIVHGAHDLVCWPIGAYLLHKELNNSKLKFIADAGHSQWESGITRKLISYTKEIMNKTK